MDQNRELEHAVSALGPPVAPTSSRESELSARHAPSHIVEMSNHPAEQNSDLPARESTSTPVLLGPSPSAPDSGIAAIPVSGQDPSSLPASRSNGSPSRSTRRNPVPQTSLTLDEGELELRSDLPLPPLPSEIRVRNSRIGFERPIPLGSRSGIDYVVPVNGKTAREKTVGERLELTLLTAITERDKYAFKAKLTGYTLNIAIGLQVILGALTTGLAAVAATSHQTIIATAILGGLSTLTASYLARARGSNEPELSITRVKDLEQFIRQCQVLQMDHGHCLGDKYDNELQNLRNRFEELLGNADGQRRLAPPV